MKKRKSIVILLIALVTFTFLVCSVAFAANISDSDSNFALENEGDSTHDLSVSSAEQTKKLLINSWTTICLTTLLSK